MGIKKWFKHLGKNVLYYPGCLTKNALKEEYQNYKDILNLLGSDFIIIPDFSCCGLPALNAGYEKTLKKLAEKNFKKLKERGVWKIITNCPSCYHTFKSIYPKYVENWNIEVEHISETLLKKIKKKKIRMKEEELVTFHDSCHLGRYEKMFEVPRELIQLLGGNIIEMRHNKKNSLCCGAGAGVRSNFENLAVDLAKKRLEEVPKKATKIISPCGLCYSNLRVGKIGEKKSEELSSFVLRRLKKWKK